MLAWLAGTVVVLIVIIAIILLAFYLLDEEDDEQPILSPMERDIMSSLWSCAADDNPMIDVFEIIEYVRLESGYEMKEHTCLQLLGPLIAKNYVRSVIPDANSNPIRVALFAATDEGLIAFELDTNFYRIKSPK